VRDTALRSVGATRATFRLARDLSTVRVGGVVESYLSSAFEVGDAGDSALIRLEGVAAVVVESVAITIEPIVKK
jgi:hypothetical protein